MARDEEPLSSDEKVRRGVGRTLANAFVLLLSVGVLAAWAYFGFYQLDPGENAIIFQFGRYARTEEAPGLRWHLPPPVQAHEIVPVATIEREEFGFTGGSLSELSPQQLDEATMQTSDNNIVHLGFVVQYRVKDAFQARYRIAQPLLTLRDAAQGAVREVVGRSSIDGVLSDRRGQVEDESLEILQTILDRYDSGLQVLAVNLQEVQPPAAVRDAFDDVIGAAQDRARTVNEAQGYANEVVPRARGEASEMREQAQGYREAKVAEARGAAARFDALLQEYRKAPEVTRQRLFLETMEEVLPDVEKIVIDPGSAQVLPYLPLERGGRLPR